MGNESVWRHLQLASTHTASESGVEAFARVCVWVRKAGREEAQL